MAKLLNHYSGLFMRYNPNYKYINMKLYFKI